MLWMFNSRGERYQGSSAECTPVPYCTYEEDDGSDRCGTQEECDIVMGGVGYLATTTGLASAILLALAF